MKKKINVGLDLGLLKLEGEWEADETQILAAWELYVELVTRIAAQPLGPDDGLVREAMTSLHALFGETRRILRAHGPGVARPASKTSLSLGAIAVDVLNAALRPFLAKWHPLLQTFEETRRPEVSPRDHERAWPAHETFRKELAVLRGRMTAYADLLADAAGVQKLHR
jgi:hypothetical protein